MAYYHLDMRWKQQTDIVNFSDQEVAILSKASSQHDIM